MVKEQLGETIDIHVGGSDLIFPHHENEIAQSEAATGKPLAHYWLHNGMVKVAGEKMSKSLGNFITIRELLAKYDPLAVRLLILGAQYRKPIDFSDEGLQAATNGWHTLQEGLSFGYKHLPPDNPRITDQELENRFQEAVNHDFNFAGGLAVLFEIAKELRKEGNNLTHAGKTDSNLAQLAVKWHTLVKLSRVLGLEIAADQGETPVSEGISAAEIENLIQQRTEAKKAKNYAESDRIRAQLKAQGISLIDQPGGVTKWLREGD
jgi:cysteinyl-tRNA synthetase